MVSNLAKYIARSPRYVLQPLDNTLIRFAGPQNLPWEEGTQIHNVSLSGLAFTAPADLCPMIGETVKIQFEVPGRQEMACLALVIRLQAVGKSTMLVAVKFIRLEMAQRLHIAQALAQKLKDQIDENDLSAKEPWWQRKGPRAAVAITLAALWLVLIHWFWLKF